MLLLVRLLSLWVCLAPAFAGRGDAPTNSITMTVQNLAGAPIEVFWKNTFSKERELVRQSSTPIRHNTGTIINSYVDHVFVVKFFDDKEDEKSVEWAKLSRPETVLVTHDEDGFHIEQRTRFDDMLDSVDSALGGCKNENSGEVDSRCVAEGLLGEYMELEASREQLIKFRDKMSIRLRNYTCADPKMESSTPIRTHSMVAGSRNMVVNDLFENEHARIWTVEEFMTQEECNILMDHGRPRLTRATVAAEDGTSIVSNSRKANQATYDLQSDKDRLKPLFDRVFEVANKKNGMDLQTEGQESFTIIQYDPDDEYYPHCDGSCDNTMHKPGGRVATAVMYCVVPEVGGATTFTKADVFVKPKPRMATFFSYYNPEDGLTDDGYTEHSGCPVLRGEKWITTVWMRKGVTADRTWEIYDPSGVEILDYDVFGREPGEEDEESDGEDEM